MVLQDLDYIFDTLDVSCHGYIEWDDVQEFDELTHEDGLDIDQIEAAIDTVSLLHNTVFSFILIKILKSSKCLICVILIDM